MLVGLSILAVVVAVVGLHFLVGIVVRLRMEKHVRTMLASTPFLAITYDDGPSSVMTPKVLELLGEWKAIATFFVVGKQVEKRPEVLQRIVSEGHELGWHTNAHLNAWRTNPIRAMRDVLSMPKVLLDSPARPRFFRAPYGKATLLTILAMRNLQQKYASWTVVTGDTNGDLPRASEIIGMVERAGGGIVLMHDHDRAFQDQEEREEFVLDLTRRLLQLAHDRQWPVLPMTAILGLKVGNG